MGDLNQAITLWGNLAISLVAVCGVFYFVYRAARMPEYREPLFAAGLVLGGVALRISPWAYGQLNSISCEPGDERVVCLYDLIIVAARPWFTMLAAVLIVWGALKFARWIERETLRWKFLWAFIIFAAAWCLPFLW